MPTSPQKKSDATATSQSVNWSEKFCGLLEEHQAITSQSSKVKMQKSEISKLARLLSNIWKNLNYNQKLDSFEKILVLGLQPSHELFLQCIGLQDIDAQNNIVRMMLARLHSDTTSLGQGEVTRLITIHPKSIDDPEVQDAIYLQLKKHGPEHCLIRTSLEGIKEVFDSHPTLQTVVPIGHGFTAQKQQIYSCGPIQGVHDDVAAAWSDLLASAPQVKHLRLVSCYYGSTNPDFDDKVHGNVQYKIDERHRLEKGTTTATVTYNPFEPVPFHHESMAGLIWENLVVRGKRKNFCLSATPLILNPLPPKDPRFFAATDKDHYTGGDGVGKPMWQDAKLRNIDKTKSITLATPDSFKLSSECSDLTAFSLEM